MCNRIFLNFFILMLVFSSCSKILGVKTRTAKPNSDLKLTVNRYTIGNKISINGFDVKVLDGDLNLFKNQGLIMINIAGTIEKRSDDVFYLERFIVIEKVIQKDTTYYPKRGCTIEIEFIPILSNKKRKRDKTVYLIENNKITFNTKLEHRVYSGSFGENLLQVKFLDKKIEVPLFQRK
jgi:hypothetical protein